MIIGEKFVRELDAALTGDLESLESIKCILKATSDFTISVLEGCGLPSSTVSILALLMTEKQIFLRAVKALTDENEAEGAKAYLSQQFRAVDNGPSSLTGELANDLRNGNASVLNVEPTYYSHHAYGSKFAFCFGAGLAADKKSQVLNIDGAPATGVRKYDWTRKIAMQLDMEEIYRLLAVLQLKSEFARFANHGPNRDKTFTIRVQPKDGVFFATLSQNSRNNMSVQIPVTAGITISIILLRQIFEAYPHLDRSSLGELLETVVQMDRLSDEANKASSGG